MEEIILKHIEAFGIIIAAIGAVFFGWKQYQINKRMKDLADYVALSIVPQRNLQLQIMNVGRVNLYLHKWEMGTLQATFVKPWLLPVEAKSSILLSFQPPPVGQHLIKLYLTDETDQKYLSTGEVVIEPVAFQLPTMAPSQQEQPQEPQEQQRVGIQQLNIALNMRAWSYKTEKHKWEI